MLATSAVCNRVCTSTRSASLKPSACAPAVASPKPSTTNCTPPANWSKERVSDAAFVIACDVSAMASLRSPAFSVSSSICRASSRPWALCLSASVRERYANSSVAISSRTFFNCCRSDCPAPSASALSLRCCSSSCCRAVFSPSSSALYAASRALASIHSLPGAAFLSAFSSRAYSFSMPLTWLFWSFRDSVTSRSSTLASSEKRDRVCPAFFRPGDTPSCKNISSATGFIDGCYCFRLLAKNCNTSSASSSAVAAPALPEVLRRPPLRYRGASLSIMISVW